MKILVIFTGGTIGSECKDGYISTTKNSKDYLLLNRYVEKYGRDVTFETFEAYNILSENLNASNLDTLVATLHLSCHSEKYDGIIITHGTDTLQYTAAALDMLFEKVNIPIVLVSSNYILSDERANGISNLRSAVLFIKAKCANGVFVSYRNRKGAALIHKGCKLLCHKQYSDDIESVSNIYFGKIEESSFVKNTKHNDYTFSKLPDIDIRNFSFVSKPNLINIKSFPGQTFPRITTGTKAILVETYHSGTLNTADNSLIEFAGEARSMNIPIFLTGIEERIAYESTKVYDDLGLYVLPKASAIACYMRLWIILSAFPNVSKDKLVEYMK